MSICFVWPFNQAKQILPNWRDGLRACLEELAKTHTVDWYLEETPPAKDYDAYLLWDDSSSALLPILGARKGILGVFLTTMPHDIANLKNADVVFCESQPVYDAVRRHGIHAVKAFGTDTNFFTPDAKVKKDILYFYPATFSPWKRQSALTHLGKNLLCVGTLQPDGINEYRACKDAGVQIEEGYFPVETIRDYYRRAKNVVIPAIHGSERTVLEAMATGLVPKVNQENAKTYSYIREYLDSGIHTPREFVLSRYTPVHYAAAVEKGLRG